MKILLTGSTGFIGSHLADALRGRGHEVHAVVRSDIDMARAGVDEWLVHLERVEVAINTVGIFRESRGKSFRDLHVDGPRALFEACMRAGVRKVVQLSALGADEGAQTPYHLSKRAADELLLRLPLQGIAVQPSLVFGEGGASARMFLAWASLPLVPLPAGGAQRVQPLHIDDAVQAIVALAESPAARGVVPLVGPQPTTLRDYLADLRRGLRLRPARTVCVPAPFMRLLARIGDHWPRLLLDTAAWQMLERGNVASAQPIAALLGRPPRPVAAFITPAHAEAARDHARLAWLLPVMRASLAMVWIVTGIVSLGVYPVEQSHDLLARAGVPAQWHDLMLCGAAGLDLALGIATLVPLRRRRWLWAAQGLLILFYTAVITLRLPEFWLHPYGPVLKNIPILAILLALAMLEPAPGKR